MSKGRDERIDHAVVEYLVSVPGPRRAKLEALHGLILGLFPDAAVDMQYRMPTYHFGEGWVALANQKSYVSLYTCGYHHIERLKARHPAIKTGKGCINFRDGDDLPLEDIGKVVVHAVRYPKGEPS